MTYDASNFYALLRGEEAADALRACLHLKLVDVLGDRTVDAKQLANEFQFTQQGGRTFFALLAAMDILTIDSHGISVTETARQCLSGGGVASRAAYLGMGSANAAELVEMLRGKFPGQSMPLYAYGGETSLMEAEQMHPIARDVAYGLASRARNFAGPLVQRLVLHGIAPQITADLGAGSPYVSLELLRQFPSVRQACLVDQAGGLRYAREMADRAAEKLDSAARDHMNRLRYVESDIFQSVPPADLYCISNTAHDWLPEDCLRIALNVREALAPGGLVVIHEPLMLESWHTPEEQRKALWMACYALTLYKLTAGQGTCYTLAEHDSIMLAAGFRRVTTPQPTVDGCTALFYQLSNGGPS